MAIINSYPTVTPTGSDLIIGTDVSTTPNSTKTFTVASINALAPQGTVTSVAITMPAAFSVSGSPVTSSGTLAITGAGSNAQLIDGTGALQTIANLPFVDGTGTTNTIPIWSDSDTLSNSFMTYDSAGQFIRFGAGPSTIQAGSMATTDVAATNVTTTNITGIGGGTVNLKGNTVIGDANTDILTINAASSFTTQATFSNGGISGGIKMSATSPLVFLDGGNATRLTIGGNITNNSVITESGSGDLILVSNTEIEIKSGELGENFAKFTKDGPIELYYDNVKKFETASSSIKILGVPVHADNTAALAAGLTAGEVYRTGDLLKIVH